MSHQNVEGILDSQILSDRIKKLGENDIHLLSVDRSVYDEQKTYSQYLLNTDEQNRAQRFLFRKDHDLFVIGRYITKTVLAHYTESIPERVRIIPDAFGKPTCEMNLYFNISHSGEQVLLGFSKSKIGVDIERIDPTVNIERIGKNYFSEVEFQKMMSCTGDKRTETFFEIWTQKEALIKGIGKGLKIPLQGFNVPGPNEKVLWEFPTENKYGNWYVQNIKTKQGFKSAFATQIERVNLSYFSHGRW